MYAKTNDRRKRLMRQAYKRLGDACACCGFVGDDLFYQIDHTHNTGAVERRMGRRASGDQLYRDVLKSNNARGLYQLLCANCNQAKARNKGVCPHEENR